MCLKEITAFIAAEVHLLRSCIARVSDYSPWKVVDKTLYAGDEHSLFTKYVTWQVGSNRITYYVSSIHMYIHELSRI